MPATIDRRVLGGLLLVALLVGGCDEENQGNARLFEMTEESLDRQAEQNREMARQNQAVAEATQELVEGDAAARRQMTELQQDVQDERKHLNQQFDKLEQERRELAAERQRAPIIAGAIRGAAILLAACLPLVLCFYLIRGLYGSGNDDEAVGELLISELASADPVLLPAAGTSEKRIEHEQAPGLPEPAQSSPSQLASTRPGPQPLLLVLEGQYDIEFLKRISRRLAAHDPRLPDLEQLDGDQRLVFLPAGGDNLGRWSERLAGLGHSEFHLYDREIEPLTTKRRQAVETVNARAGCRAVLTGKRSLENYLHPDAVREASGIDVSFSDEDDLPELLARHELAGKNGPAWEELSRRSRRRLREKAKRLLNTEAVEAMTPDRLAERDPHGELVGWLQDIGRLAGPSSESGAKDFRQD